MVEQQKLTPEEVKTLKENNKKSVDLLDKYYTSEKANKIDKERAQKVIDLLGDGIYHESLRQLLDAINGKNATKKDIYSIIVAIIMNTPNQLLVDILRKATDL